MPDLEKDFFEDESLAEGDIEELPANASANHYFDSEIEPNALKALAIAWQDQQDTQARDDFIRGCKSLVKRIARKIVSNGRFDRVTVDDLIGEGYVRLWQALQEKQLRNAENIFAFLGTYIKDSMRQFADGNQSSESMPARSHRRYSRTLAEYSRFKSQGEITKEAKEKIIACMGYQPIDFNLAIDEMRMRLSGAQSLDAPVTINSDISYGATLPSSSNDDPEIKIEERLEALSQFFYVRVLFENANLSRLEKNILYHRIFADETPTLDQMTTQRRIGEVLGLTQSAIDGVVKRSLRKMVDLSVLLESNPMLYERLFNYQRKKFEEGRSLNLDYEPVRGMSRQEQIAARQMDVLFTTIDGYRLPVEFATKLNSSRALHEAQDQNLPLILVKKGFEIEDFHELETAMKPWGDGGILGVLIPDAFNQNFGNDIKQGQIAEKYFSLSDLKLKIQLILEAGDSGQVARCINKKDGKGYYFISAKHEALTPFIRLSFQILSKRLSQVIPELFCSDEKKLSSDFTIRGRDVEVIRMGAISRNREALLKTMSNDDLPMIVTNMQDAITGILVTRRIADMVIANDFEKVSPSERMVLKDIPYKYFTMKFSEASQNGAIAISATSERYNSAIVYLPDVLVDNSQKTLVNKTIEMISHALD